MQRMLLILFAISCSALAQSLDALIKSRGRDLFNTSQRYFLQSLQLKNLTWNTADQTQIRFSKSISGENFTFCNIPVVEAVFDFTDKKVLSAIQVSIFNRGDCGTWSKQRFDSTVSALQISLGNLTKVRQGVKSKRKIDSSRIEQMLWRNTGYDLALRWCEGDNSCEYITVIIAPKHQIKDVGQEMKTAVKGAGLINNVKKEVNGTRWIEVPMVNQGDKGYCVSAVLERLMKYYNSAADQHVFAQLTESDSTLGTDIFRTLDALEASDSKLRIRVKVQYKDKAFMSTQGLIDLVKDYNRTASKRNFPKLNDKAIAKNPSLAFVFSGIDKDTFIASREKRKPGCKRFQLLVQESIDRGIPLMWTILVLPKELPRQPLASLHARIINGYNSKTSEIIYTDSWGYGHEKKSMPAAEAWAITTTILAITPR